MLLFIGKFGIEHLLLFLFLCKGDLHVVHCAIIGLFMLLYLLFLVFDVVYQIDRVPAVLVHGVNYEEYCL